MNVVSSPRAPTPVSRVSTPEVPEVRRGSVSSESTQSSVDYATRVQDPRGEHRSSYANGPDKGNFLAENANIFSSIKNVRFGCAKEPSHCLTVVQDLLVLVKRTVILDPLIYKKRG